MIKVKHSGDFSNIESFFRRMNNKNYQDLFERAADRGLAELKANTPKDTGKTADSWSYDIRVSKGSATITWNNSNVLPSGTPIVFLLHYGYSTKSGYYIQGRDFINPALTPVFDKLISDIWKEVIK